MVVIRSANREDVAGVLALWGSATAPSATDDAESLVHLIESAPAALLVAADGPTIVGTVVAGWDGWRGTMYRLAVDPKRRREGIAAMLVRDAETILRERGARRLHLIVESNRPVAQSFWISVGYEPTDQTRFVKTLEPA